ncbi:ceramide kinase-like [Mustelus asterias]
MELPDAHLLWVEGEPGRGSVSAEALKWTPLGQRGDPVFHIVRESGCLWAAERSLFTAPSLWFRDYWIHILGKQLQPYEGKRPVQLVIIINPCGGQQRGRGVYEDSVAPLFREAGITTRVLVSQRAGQLRDWMLTADLGHCDGVVCVGGDGTFNEVMQGLIDRAQLDAGMSERDPGADLVPPSLRIGIIPAGSTDCVCYSTVGVCDPVTSALHIIIGDSQPLDVCSIHRPDSPARYAVSLLGHGFYGDVLADSSGRRWMGPRRYEYSGICVHIHMYV